MAWNYKFDSVVVDIGRLSDLTVTDAENELNDKSSKGWELISTIPVPNEPAAGNNQIRLLLLYRMPL